MQTNSKERLTFWKQKLQEHRKSGLSRRAFCEQNRIKKTTLDYWFARIRISSQKKTKGLVELKPPSTPILNGSPLIVVSGKYRIEVHSGFDPHLLCELLKTLESLA